MARPRKRPPPPRRPARSHDELPRHVDWQNPRVVEILDSASRCFARDGLAETTIQQIAKEAGFTKSMIHYYFASKQVLIDELQLFVHDRHFRRVQQQLMAINPNADELAGGALWELFEIIKDKEFLRLQLELLAESGRDEHMKQRMQLALERSRELVEMGVVAVVNAGRATPIAVPKELSLLISSLMLGLRTYEFVSGDDEVTKGAFRIFSNMLRTLLKQSQTKAAP